MIYTKVVMQLEVELNIPMSKAVSVEEAQAEIEKDGGKDGFVKAMGDEVIKGFSSPFSTGRLISGTVDVVQV